MDLDITQLFLEIEPRYYSASEYEMHRTGQITWDNAIQATARWPLLADAEGMPDPDKVGAAREFIRGTGGWSRAEVDAMTVQVLTALVIQFIAGDMREAGFDKVASHRRTWDSVWSTYHKRVEDGELSGSMDMHTSKVVVAPSKVQRVKRVYFYLGS